MSSSAAAATKPKPANDDDDDDEMMMRCGVVATRGRDERETTTPTSHIQPTNMHAQMARIHHLVLFVCCVSLSLWLVGRAVVGVAAAESLYVV